MIRGLRALAVVMVLAFVVIYIVSRHNATTSTTTTTSISSTTTTNATTTTATPMTTCVASDFTGVYNEGEGAAGTIYASATLTKNTTGSCTLYGWPILTLQDKFGAVLESTSIDSPSSTSSFQFLSAAANAKPAALTLGPNAKTTFSLAYNDVQSGTTKCASAVTVSVQFVATGASVPLTPPSIVQACGNGQVWVSPFY